MEASAHSTPAVWEEFLRDYYKKEVLKLNTERTALYVDYFDVERRDTSLARALVVLPRRVLNDARDGLHNYLADLPGKEGIPAEVRVHNLPQRHKIRDLRTHHMGTLLAIAGQVKRATEVRPQITRAFFRCTHCGEEQEVAQLGGLLVEPMSCVCGRRGPFELVHEKSSFRNSQKVRVEEFFEDMDPGEQPQSIEVLLEEDLTALANPGDRVVVTGILHAQPRRGPAGKQTTFDLFLEGVHIAPQQEAFEEVEITEQDEQQILELSVDPRVYQKLVRSIAPSIYGYEDIKECIVLQLFGGVPKMLPDGTRIRGDIHMLLVGDPGIAKSQLLRYVVQLSPRGIYASGRSASTAGLTAAAIKDDFGDGRFSLEAGALVLADRGVAAVDELDKMDEHDRSALHEAMEQQTISFNKAGISATLNCRCSLLGAANPKAGRFSGYKNFSEEVNIGPALLTRFDLLFAKRDKPTPDLDRKLAHHIVHTHLAGELQEQRRRNPSAVSQKDVERVLEIVKPDVDPLLVRKYIAYARKEVFPSLSPEAMEVLERFYTDLRAEGTGEDESRVPVTPRLLESVVRMAEASARVRLSSRITVDDAVRATRVMRERLWEVYRNEEGQIEMDVIAVGVSSAENKRMQVLREVIVTLNGEREGVKQQDILDEVLGRARKADPANFTKEKEDKALQQTLRDIEKMRDRGDIFITPSKLIKITASRG